MAKKIISIISIILVSSLTGIFFLESSSIDRELYSNTFAISAIYYQEQGYVEISFLDSSGRTQSTVLEILGMEESFQKKILGPEFIERVPFSSIPQYGWKTNPVTLVIDHAEFGIIGAKTEIHEPMEPEPPIIFSNL